MLGLILSDDGLYYEDDPGWVDPVEDVATETAIDNMTTVEDAGTFVETQTVEQAIPELAPVEEKPLPPPPPEPEYRYDPPVPTPEPLPQPEPERSSWTSEPSESSWSSSSDSGSSWDSGGGSDFGGGSDD
ncbi:MAG: hypothetical protein ACXAC5_04480 [Promethearchaeota archaeon]